MRIFLQVVVGTSIVQATMGQDYNNCVEAQHAGESSGVYGIGGADTYCDMDIDGGGWAYMARGTYASDGCTADAYGSVSTDPDTNSRWSFGQDVMNTIGHSDSAIWMEYLVTIGVSNDNSYTAQSKYRKFRIFGEIDMSEPLDGTFGVEVWYGNGFIPEPDDCTSSDCGPCWEPNDVNYCCEKDDDSFLTTCDIAVQGAEGQWSNANTNQHLRCDVSDYDQDQLVMYARPKVFYPLVDECFASCVDVRDAGFFTSGVYCIQDLNLYCNMDLHGGGWAMVARGTDPNDGCNAEAFGGGACSAPDCNARWSVGGNVMNDIGHSGAQGVEYMEYIWTVGYSNDDGMTPHEYYRLQRTAGDMDMSQPMDVTYGVETWDGSTWVAQEEDCNDSDCGPCAEPNDTDFCCTTTDGSCALASYATEGQWSNANTNQHLRCDQADYDQDALVLYVRPDRKEPLLTAFEKALYKNVTALFAAVADIDSSVASTSAAVADVVSSMETNVDAIDDIKTSMGSNADSIDDILSTMESTPSLAVGADTDNSFVIDGSGNTVEGDNSIALGGADISVTGNFANAAGGKGNVVISNYASVVGGFQNVASGRFSAVLGGSSSIAGGRHSFTLGSFGVAKGDYSGVINAAGKSGCVAEQDNQVKICADTLKLDNGDSVIDLGSLGRRMLEQDSVRDELAALRDENRELRERIEALEQR